MTYGLNARLFVEDGPAAQAAKRPVSSARWRRLGPDRRIELVERALTAPANDLIDPYPLAL